MSASGILNSGAVVFYHPLDNSTEHTLSQDWVGSAEYATGEVGNGLFANIGTTVTVDNPVDILSEGFIPAGLANCVRLTDTKFAIAYSDTVDVVGVRIVNISGTTPTYGTEYLFTAPDILNTQIHAFSPSSVILVHRSGDTPTNRGFIRQLDIDGSDIITSGASFIIGEFIGSSISACIIDDTRALVTFGGTTEGYVTIFELSGGVWTSGNIEIISDMRTSDTCFLLNSSGCIFNYNDLDTDGQVRVIQLPVSGVDITAVGASYEFSPTYGLGGAAGSHTNGGMCKLTDSKFMIFFKEGNRGRLMAADVVGNNITLGTDEDIISWYGHGQITRLTDDKCMVIYKNQDAFPVVSNVRVCSVAGLTVTVGTKYIFSDEDPGVTDSVGPINTIAGINPASAFVFYTEHTASERHVKLLTVDTSDASLMGSGYPSMSGYTRVAACMWARNLTAPVSTVNVERGYSIQMTSGSIVLGGAATWDDGDITTLMDSLNDDSAHFLVLDFENTGSNWNLKTSVDGVTWVDQGNQNTGSLSPVLTDTSGEVSITNPEAGQWIDEAVLWGGDKATLDIFTDNELLSLFTLAGSGLTMAEYTAVEGPAPGATEVNDNFDMYILNMGEVATSGDLYVAGLVQVNDSIDLFIESVSIVTLQTSGDLYIQGSDATTASINLFIAGQDSISTSGDLFIRGANIVLLSGDLFIEGVDNVSASGDLFLQGLDIIQISGDLFAKGQDLVAASGNLYVAGPIFTFGQVDLFISGTPVVVDSESGSVTLYINGIDTTQASVDLFIWNDGLLLASGNFDLFINGEVAISAVVCPPLDATASIQIKPALIAIYQSRIDALINQLGKNVRLIFDPVLTPCPNCLYDVLRKRSNGIYRTGGPRPFKRGRKCPYCKGRGLNETSVEKCIKCLLKWNPKDAENYGISIGQKKGIVRMKTFLTSADDMMQAKTAIANYDINAQMKLNVKLIRGPIPVGLREDRYCISFWELL